jgi:hypothetical protein
MMKERLELVRDFAELREGMIVVLKPCQSCGRRERGLLIAIQVIGDEPEDDSVPGEPGWETLPMCPAVPALITATSVRRGCVFRVVDGLEAPSVRRGCVFRVVDGLEAPARREPVAIGWKPRC